MDGIVGLIISLISGAVGGNIAGGVLKEQSLGTLGNTIAGLVGGGLGGQILSALMGSSGAAQRPSDEGELARFARRRRAALHADRRRRHTLRRLRDLARAAVGESDDG